MMEQFGKGSFHQHASTWKWTDDTQPKDHQCSFRIPPLLKSYIRRLGTCHSLEMEVGAWDQSAHLLFVQLFLFPRVSRTGPWRWSLSALALDERSKNKQIGSWNTCMCTETEAEPCSTRQKLAACVNDDIRPPTFQLSRSSHICSIE